ncbi:hypothetical protein OY671_008893 [Metschnikowia pulcherrima]|nr:hypothetical protein OY671_008893 [Metschnikowia pulcherrima]
MAQGDRSPQDAVWPDCRSNLPTGCGSRKSLAAPCRVCEIACPMADPRISHIELDEATILWRNADIEQERRIAIFDSIEENTFRPIRAFEAGHTGPYRSRSSVEDGRSASVIADERENSLETIILGLGRFRRPIRDYFAICDSYYQAIRRATAQEIETIDMARRGVHNDAAEMSSERLDGKVETDFATARRLFTLICVLHIRG